MKSTSCPRWANAPARLVFTIAALATTTLAYADQLVVNGGFDQGHSAWVANPAFPGFAPVFDGHISVDTPDFSNRWIARQNLNVTAPAGAELSVSADLIASWPGSGNTFSLIVEYADNLDTIHQATLLSVDASAVDTTSFTSHSTTFTVPGNARKLTGLIIARPASGPPVEADNISVSSPALTPGPLPTISSVAPSEAPYGSTVTIEGSDFGTDPGTVTIGGRSDGISITSWGDTRISLEVMEPAASGRLEVSADLSSSHDDINFRVTSPHFTFSTLSDNLTVIRGNPLRAVVAAGFYNGFDGSVVPSVPDDNTGSATFNPATVTGSGGTLLSIDTTQLAPGTYTRTLRGANDGSPHRDSKFTFTVAEVDSFPLGSFGVPVRALSTSAARRSIAPGTNSQATGFRSLPPIRASSA